MSRRHHHNKGTQSQHDIAVEEIRLKVKKLQDNVKECLGQNLEKIDRLNSEEERIIARKIELQKKIEVCKREMSEDQIRHTPIAESYADHVHSISFENQQNQRDRNLHHVHEIQNAEGAKRNREQALNDLTLMFVEQKKTIASLNVKIEKERARVKKPSVKNIQGKFVFSRGDSLRRILSNRRAILVEAIDTLDHDALALMEKKTQLQNRLKTSEFQCADLLRELKEELSALQNDRDVYESRKRSMELCTGNVITSLQESLMDVAEDREEVIMDVMMQISRMKNMENAMESSHERRSGFADTLEASKDIISQIELCLNNLDETMARSDFENISNKLNLTMRRRELEFSIQTIDATAQSLSTLSAENDKEIEFLRNKLQKDQEETLSNVRAVLHLKKRVLQVVKKLTSMKKKEGSLKEEIDMLKSNRSTTKHRKRTGNSTKLTAETYRR